jgi:hypothetical protein
MSKTDWHHKIRDCLNGHVRDPNFYVWLRVEQFPDELREIDEAHLRMNVQNWLTLHDPDDFGPDTDDWPRLEWGEGDDLAVELIAIPKKPEARHSTSPEIVGNSDPAMAFYPGEPGSHPTS